MKIKNFNEIKEKIKLLGRCAVLNETLYCEFTASGFEFSADFNNTPVFLKLTLNGEMGMIGVVIDFDEDSLLQIPISYGSQTVKIAETLNGVHTVKIIKLNEYNRNTVDFQRIMFNGALCERPKNKKLLFEFYGDSLTCGYGNLCTSRATPAVHGFLQDGNKTWAALISRFYDADFNVCASSGQGVLTDCAGNPNGVMDRYYNMCLPTKNMKWDFAHNIPDFVFYNFGTNDMNYYKSCESAEPDWDKFAAKVKSLFDFIRSNAPECTIIIPMGHDANNPYFKPMMDTYKELAKGFDKMYVFDDLTNKQLGGDWHPNLDDHKLIFTKLKNHMQNDLHI